MTICPKCGNLSVADDSYCYKDGEEMGRAPMCSCGRGLSPVEVYCPKCGVGPRR